MSGPFKLHFGARDEPLVPTAAAVPREAARALVERWRRAPSEMASLRAAASPSTLFFFGDADVLPWVDGVVYLGHDPAAPRLLVPTALAPNLPFSLVERALLQRTPQARPPCALLLDPLRLVDVSSPASVDVASVDRWLARSR